MGYSIIIIIVVGIAYIWYCEWQDVESIGSRLQTDKQIQDRNK